MSSGIVQRHTSVAASPLLSRIGLRVTLIVRRRGLLLFAALELVLELEEGLAASTAAMWSSSAQLQWFGQCGRLCHVLVSCSHARVLNFSVPPAAAPGAGALLAMVVRLLGQRVTACLVAQQAPCASMAAHSDALCLVHVCMLPNLVCCRWFAALEKEVAP